MICCISETSSSNRSGSVMLGGAVMFGSARATPAIAIIKTNMPASRMRGTHHERARASRQKWR
jgi:hypothetical protein